MKEEALRTALVKEFGPDRVKSQEVMSRHTTFRIGGPADLYFEARSVEEIQRALSLSQEFNCPHFILGLGANLLVGDRGIRGLVIRPMLSELKIVGPHQPVEETSRQVGSSGHYKSYDDNHYLKFDDLEMVEPEPDTLIRAGAGFSLPLLIMKTIELRLTGLQNFAGIPASVGGAVYNNVHGGTRLLDEFIHQVVVLDKLSRVATVNHDEMAFGYDESRVQQSGEVVLTVDFKLSHGDVAKAEWVRSEWIRRKFKVQPQTHCPGCIFKNLTVAQAQKIGAPTVAAGWVLDVGLGLKGVSVGGISVSAKHANFFVNSGQGKASEVLQLIRLCQERAKEKFGLDLKEEIQIVGEL